MVFSLDRETAEKYIYVFIYSIYLLKLMFLYILVRTVHPSIHRKMDHSRQLKVMADMFISYLWNRKK